MATLDMKEAARLAKGYISDLYAPEEINNVGLEEIEFDSDTGHWKVTVGFSRPWDRIKNKTVAATLGYPRAARSYKVVSISDDTSKVESVKDYDLAGLK
jgi:hypothetical protein